MCDVVGIGMMYGEQSTYCGAQLSNGFGTSEHRRAATHINLHHFDHTSRASFQVVATTIPH
jgi:hypothetical protein